SSDLADLVLITGADAAAGGAYSIFRALLAQPFFFQVVGEDHMSVITDDEVVADVDAGFPQVLDFFKKSRRVDDHAVGDHRSNIRPKHAGGEKREFERLAVADDGVAGVGPAVVANDDIVLVGEEIDDLAFGLVAPLQADDTRA